MVPRLPLLIKHRETQKALDSNDALPFLAGRH